MIRAMLQTFNVVLLSGQAEPQRIDTDRILAIAPGRPVAPAAGIPNGSTIAMRVDGRNGWFLVAGDYHASEGADLGAGRLVWDGSWKFDVGLIADDSVPSDIVDTRDGSTDVVDVCVSKAATVGAPRFYLGTAKRTYTLGDASVELVSDESAPKGAFGSVH